MMMGWYKDLFGEYFLTQNILFHKLGHGEMMCGSNTLGGQDSSTAEGFQPKERSKAKRSKRRTALEGINVSPPREKLNDHLQKCRFYRESVSPQEGTHTSYSSYHWAIGNCQSHQYLVNCVSPTQLFNIPNMNSSHFILVHFGFL